MMDMKMEEISREKFEEAMKIAPIKINEEKEITEEDFSAMLKQMQNPVNSQKEIAVKVKLFLDKRIKDEMEKNGVLGDNTRKWIETYTTLLEKLQRAIHGDKSLNLHVHQVTHGDIAAKMREVVVLDKNKVKG
jgi:hypothetical protein